MSGGLVGGVATVVALLVGFDFMDWQYWVVSLFPLAAYMIGRLADW